MHRYRSMQAWKAARRLSLKVLENTDEHYQARARTLFDQLRRAAVSIELNIVEGYALQSPQQLQRHVKIALGSAAETECVLELVAARGYLPADTAKDLLDLTDTTLGLLFGLMRKLRGD